MRWSEFVLWALERHGLRLDSYPSQKRIWKIIWQENESNANQARSGTGSGHPARYGARERRRVTAWLRLHELVALDRQSEWLRLAGRHGSGYLYDDGSGVCWSPDVAPMMESWRAGRAVVSVGCGE